MSVLTRLEEIMLSEINALLDDMENPSIMLEQYLRNMQDDLESIKNEIANLVAEEKRIQKLIDQHNLQIQNLENYASKALEACNEDDARTFLTKKAAMLLELSSLEQQYDNAMLDTQNIKERYDKLAIDVSKFEGEMPMLKAKFAQAKLQGSVNQITDGSISEDKANAMLELNKMIDHDTECLKNKYDADTINHDVEDELIRLKQSMNIKQK